MVLNMRPLDWESSTLTTRPLLHIALGTSSVAFQLCERIQDRFDIYKSFTVSTRSGQIHFNGFQWFILMSLLLKSFLLFAPQSRSVVSNVTRRETGHNQMRVLGSPKLFGA